MADVRAYAATPFRQGSFSLVLFIVAAWAWRTAGEHCLMTNVDHARLFAGKVKRG